MICQQKSCGGKINHVVQENLITGCGGCGFSRTPASPCRKCGLLHFPNGSAAINRATEKGAFLSEGRIIHKDFELA